MTLFDDLKPLRTEYMAAPFWFWNDVMDPTEIRRQVVEMAARNMGGFFMHARMGRVTPYMSKEWMSAIRAAVDEAKKAGINAWIYDEDGWPSGFGGGLVNALGEDYLQQYALAEEIAIEGQPSLKVDKADQVLAVYVGRKTGTGFQDVQRMEPQRLTDGRIDLAGLHGTHAIVFRRELHNYRRYFSPEAWADGYVDVLDPKVTRAFIRKIYEPYRREIGDAFGTTVPGVFTDEPSYHECDWMANLVRLPFSPVLEKEFAKRFGAPLVDALMAIGYGGENALRARWCYYAALAHLFAYNYTRILAEWCGKHDLAFTGHYLLEEYPRAATHVVGDVMQHYYYQQYPGIDHLGKDLDLKDFWSSARVLVKQAASVAHQFEKPRVMCETYAGGGWHFGIQEQKWMGDWQYALGLNLCCQHAFHYSLRGFRKRDYPPSLGFQQPWYPFSADLGSHFSRLGYLLTRGTRVVNVLVLHPIESFFATHEAAGFPWDNDPLSDSLKQLAKALLSRQIDFDFGNEVLIKKHGHIDGKQFRIGQGCYDVVIVPHSVTWRKPTLSKLRQFVAAGGKLFFVEPTPTHVEGIPSGTYSTLFARANSLGSWNSDGFERTVAERVTVAAEPTCHLSGEQPDDVLVMHRRTNDHDIFFLTSASKTPHRVQAQLEAPGTPKLLDTATGQMSIPPHERDGVLCRVELDFDYARSFPIIFDRTGIESCPRDEPVSEQCLVREHNTLEYHLNDDNILILDHAELIIDGQSRGRMFHLDAQQTLMDLGSEPAARLRFTFTSETPVANACLLLERPEDFNISVNGRRITCSSAADWFIDPCLRRGVISGGLQAGQNVVDVDFKWHKDLELERLYVLGRFGVEENDGRCRMTPLPERLRVGSWHDQGLPFYAGTVTYSFDVEVDVSAAGRWELCCPEYASAIRVLVNGVESGTILWAPHRLDVTDYLKSGLNRIDVEVANNLRNMLGPHHLGREDDIDCLGPLNFFEKETRTTKYRFKPAGLLGQVVLNGYRTKA